MSKLRKRLSGVFRGKKADLAMSGGLGFTSGRLDSISEDSEDDVAISPLIHEHVLEEQHLQQAVVNSLCDQNEALQQDQTSRNATVQLLDEQLRARTGELQSMHQDQTRFDALLRELQVTVHSLRRDKNSLEQGNTQLASELRHYQTYWVKNAATLDQLQQKVDALEFENYVLEQSTDCSVVEIQRDRIQLGNRLVDLEAATSQERAEREEEQRVFVDLHNCKNTADDENKALAETVTLLNQEMEVIKAESSETFQKLQEVQQKYDAEQGDARYLWSDPTPRQILVRKIISQSFQASAADCVQPNAIPFLQSCSSDDLTKELLDIGLTTRRARRFVDNVASDGLTILVCDQCQLPKLAQRPDAQLQLGFSEFARPAPLTDCCSTSVCSECYGKQLVMSLTRDWRPNPEPEILLICPTPDCNQPLTFTDRQDVENLLLRLVPDAAEKYMATYDHMQTLQDSLNTLQYLPNDTAIRVSSDLHASLASSGRMNWTFGSVPGNENNTGPQPVRMISVDHEGGIEIPLFTSLFRRNDTARECVICTDELFEVDIGSVQQWTESCRDFGGEWMWQVLEFPVKLGLACSHEIDFCSGCLEQHLKSQLEQYGKSRCDQLACPSYGCGRRLTYDEIRLYASPETFVQYDRYLNLNALSRYPGFRWCLREGCSNGQLYEDDEDAALEDPQVFCEDCGFEMCFNHSVPWHEGQTCDQFDSTRQHGDPEFQQTQDWIAQNTKPCPGCQENIQKGEFCFHMTCSSCQFEFCWECLADWKLIAPTAGRHNPDAHREGCGFRTNGLAPTDISGTDLQEALQRRAR